MKHSPHVGASKHCLLLQGRLPLGFAYVNLLDVITCNRRPSHSSGLAICKAAIPSLRRSPTYCSHTQSKKTLLNKHHARLASLGRTHRGIHARRASSYSKPQTTEMCEQNKGVQTGQVVPQRLLYLLQEGKLCPLLSFTTHEGRYSRVPSVTKLNVPCSFWKWSSRSCCRPCETA